MILKNTIVGGIRLRQRRMAQKRNAAIIIAIAENIYCFRMTNSIPRVSEMRIALRNAT